MHFYKVIDECHWPDVHQIQIRAGAEGWIIELIRLNHESDYENREWDDKISVDKVFWFEGWNIDYSCPGCGVSVDSVSWTFSITSVCEDSFCTLKLLIENGNKLLYNSSWF